MGARKSSKVNPKYKTKYRVGNWREYERGLRSRGDVTIWFSADAVGAWTPPRTGRRGGQQRYSDLAILTSLTVRLVFHLPLRQTEGFVASLLRLMDLDLGVPDHTTLSRRNKDVNVTLPTRALDGPIHLIVDSTGLKILGAGEWHSHKHKAGKARRDWRKLHVGVDAEGFVVATKLTESTVDDASVVPELLEQVGSPIERFTGDGAYDRRSVYEEIGKAGTPDVAVVVPPRRAATASTGAAGMWAQRNEHLKRIDEIGRQQWLKESGYRKQAGAENAFMRYKQILGGRLRAKVFEAQQKESIVGCNVLNQMYELGRPESYAVTE